jgi:hypothetical protein
MNRTLLEIAAAIVFIGATVWYLEHRGAERCLAADVAAVQKQEVKNAEIHGAEVVEVKHEAEEFKRETAVPITDAPIVRVCPQPARAKPATSAPGPLDHGAAVVREENPGVPATSEWDSTGVVQAGRDADRQIEALERYITDVCSQRH